MHHDFIDKYSRLNSPVHRLPAAVKLPAALALLLGIVLLPTSRPAAFAIPAAVLLAVIAVSGIPIGFLVRRLLMLEPLAMGIALLSLFQPGGGMIFCAVLIRATLCLLTVILLSNTTPFASLLQTLRRLRVPALLITTLALMYRYVFVLLDELERLRRARAARTFRRSRRQAWQGLAESIGQLWIRSTDRAERIFSAMCARGWKP